jgi:hypothetical protein
MVNEADIIIAEKQKQIKVLFNFKRRFKGEELLICGDCEME